MTKVITLLSVLNRWYNNDLNCSIADVQINYMTDFYTLIVHE